MPSGWVDLLGNDVVLHHPSVEGIQTLADQLPEILPTYDLHPDRIFQRILPRKNEDRSNPILLQGDPALPLQTHVRENGLRFELDFTAGYSTGLFLDQRTNRRYLEQTVRPKRLLNLFAYTCAFTVAAARAGAETCSVDLSRKSLDRGKANLALNGFPTEPHRFYADDVMDVLPRLERRDERFDCVILDPPTFSRGNKGRRFQVEDHLSEVLSSVIPLCQRNASILLSTNCTAINQRTLEGIAAATVRAHRRGASYHREPLTPDLRGPAISTTLWIHLR
jgi:23S rRNA (cytosine1962-C5)-methyltransferase